MHFAGSLEPAVGIGQRGALREAEIDMILRTDHVAKCFLEAARESKCGGDGIPDVIYRFAGGRNLAQHGGANGQIQLPNGRIVAGEKLDELGMWFSDNRMLPKKLFPCSRAGLPDARQLSTRLLARAARKVSVVLPGRDRKGAIRQNGLFIDRSFTARWHPGSPAPGSYNESR